MRHVREVRKKRSKEYNLNRKAKMIKTRKENERNTKIQHNSSIIYVRTTVKL